ncbi:Daunorubicin/doxorubicin resistance ATP-binding protein DrrA [Actinomyces bovis]|uniref:Daunorubicin/doxorubicin resistance ATP-binding protein DrrA n=1 Tax=Actinomyces bovis TaxID=1658 RepID=A0ABY1VNX6_9ACTO|nr:ABC transporter ATP-binding protein [Actinomyces bovis]SPT53376.1 Daunorubicin/doxorubicin resistance ATP-binding protein DrrA [Actinomyces bovis]VEG52768.1 Daunorubicin/doxorubicin resistance ATP-binding protein DrrA [Actinomyces israelii]
MSKSLSDCVVEARGLQKHFGKVHALNGLDLTVTQGQVHGFLGPNGSGKSTTIRALLGQIRLDSGFIKVFGQDAWTDAVSIHRRLAYVPGDTMLWPGLTGGQCIDLLGGFHGSLNQRRRDQLVERFELDPSRRFRTYSKGNRQKVALVAALACDVELMVLDEPTSGLDPLMESVFQKVVAELAEAGTSVLLSSHILAEVEALCDAVTVVREGQLALSGTLEELRSSATTAVDVVTPEAVTALAAMAGVSRLELREDPRGIRTTLLVTSTALPTVLKAVSAAQPLEVAVHPPSLEQLFLERYSQDGGEV